MKKLSFVFAGLALVASAAFTSCEKDPAPVADEGLKSIALSINFGGVGTKAEVNADLESSWVSDFDEFISLDLYFTNSSDNIIYYYHAEKTDADGNGKIIWDNLFGTATSPNKGVRFIGMSDVAKVYVVANGPSLDNLTVDANGVVTSGPNISSLNDKISLLNYLGAQNTMLYAGAAESLEVASTVAEGAGSITVGEPGGRDYKAEITIRPALSRIEISEAGILTEGEVYYKVVNDELEKTTATDATYKVTFAGFDPILVGVYASNIYRESPLFPVQTDASAWTSSLFATPTFDAAGSPVEEGKWKSLASEADLNDYLSYANWTGTTYDHLVGTEYRNDSPNTSNELLLFNGNKPAEPTNRKVIPFNFFVPYNITDEATDVNALSGSAVPAIHFQFKKGSDITPTIEYRATTSDAWGNVPAGDNFDTDIKDNFTWPAAVGTEENTAFANVVDYFKTNPNTDPDAQAITLKPGYIYRVQKVIVDPSNITVSTKSTSQYNVHVVVTVVPYNEVNVHPGFDK